MEEGLLHSKTQRRRLRIRDHWDSMNMVCEQFLYLYILLKVAVPIYDARNDDRFLFTNANMDQLRELPLYTGTNNQPCDLPRDTLAMVGYAINTFTYNGSLHPGAVAVSFNVLFVIALGDVDRPLLEEISEKMA